MGGLAFESSHGSRPPRARVVARRADATALWAAEVAAKPVKFRVAPQKATNSSQVSAPINVNMLIAAATKKYRSTVSMECPPPLTEWRQRASLIRLSSTTKDSYPQAIRPRLDRGGIDLAGSGSAFDLIWASAPNDADSQAPLNSIRNGGKNPCFRPFYCPSEAHE